MIIRLTFLTSTFGSEFFWSRGDEWPKPISPRISCQEVSRTDIHGSVIKDFLD